MPRYGKTRRKQQVGLGTECPAVTPHASSAALQAESVEEPMRYEVNPSFVVAAVCNLGLMPGMCNKRFQSCSLGWSVHWLVQATIQIDGISMPGVCSFAMLTAGQTAMTVEAHKISSFCDAFLCGLHVAWGWSTYVFCLLGNGCCGGTNQTQNTELICN